MTTQAVMRHRKDALLAFAREHHPCTVRSLYYRALAAGLPGIGKDDKSAENIGKALLNMRRNGEMPYSWIVDSSRSVYRVDQWDGLGDYVEDVAYLYRRDLWRDVPAPVEVWCESESIASMVIHVTSRWRVGLYPIRGQCSESYAYEAARSWTDGRPRVILYLGDHDFAGLNIERNLKKKLTMFGGPDALAEFRRVGVTWEQIEELNLPGEPPKFTGRKPETLARQRREYPWPLAVQAEALPPATLRELLEAAILEYVDQERLNLLRTVEEEERSMLLRLAESTFASRDLDPDGFDPDDLA